MCHGHPITLAHGQRNPVQIAMEHVTWHYLLLSLENKGDFRKFCSGIHNGYQKANKFPSPPTLLSLFQESTTSSSLTRQASITEIDQTEDSEPAVSSVEVDSLRAEIARYASERESLLAKQAAELEDTRRRAAEEAKTFIREEVQKASLEISEKVEKELKLEKRRAKQAAKAAQEATINAEKAFMQKTIEALNLDDDGLELTGSISNFGSFINNLKLRSSSLAPSQKGRSLTPSTSSPQPSQSPMSNISRTSESQTLVSDFGTIVAPSSTPLFADVSPQLHSNPKVFPSPPSIATMDTSPVPGQQDRASPLRTPQNSNNGSPDEQDELIEDGATYEQPTSLLGLHTLPSMGSNTSEDRASMQKPASAGQLNDSNSIEGGAGVIGITPPTFGTGGIDNVLSPLDVLRQNNGKSKELPKDITDSPLQPRRSDIPVFTVIAGSSTGAVDTLSDKASLLQELPPVDEITTGSDSPQSLPADVVGEKGLGALQSSEDYRLAEKSAQGELSSSILSDEPLEIHDLTRMLLVSKIPSINVVPLSGRVDDSIPGGLISYEASAQPGASIGKEGGTMKESRGLEAPVDDPGRTCTSASTLSEGSGVSGDTSSMADGSTNPVDSSATTAASESTPSPGVTRDVSSTTLTPMTATGSTSTPSVSASVMSQGSGGGGVQAAPLENPVASTLQGPDLDRVTGAPANPINSTSFSTATTSGSSQGDAGSTDAEITAGGDSGSSQGDGDPTDSGTKNDPVTTTAGLAPAATTSGSGQKATGSTDAETTTGGDSGSGEGVVDSTDLEKTTGQTATTTSSTSTFTASGSGQEATGSTDAEITTGGDSGSGQGDGDPTDPGTTTGGVATTTASTSAATTSGSSQDATGSTDAGTTTDGTPGSGEGVVESTNSGTTTGQTLTTTPSTSTVTTATSSEGSGDSADAATTTGGPVNTIASTSASGASKSTASTQNDPSSAPNKVPSKTYATRKSAAIPEEGTGSVVIRKSLRNLEKAQPSYSGSQSGPVGATKRKAPPAVAADSKRAKVANEGPKDTPTTTKRSKKPVRAISLAHSPDPAYTGFPMTSFIGKINGSLGTIDYGDTPASLNRFTIDDPLIDGDTPNDIPLPWKTKVHIKLDLWELTSNPRPTTPSNDGTSEYSVRRVSKLFEFRTNTKSNDWKRLLKIMRLAFAAEEIARFRDPLYDTFKFTNNPVIPHSHGLVLVSPDFHLLDGHQIRTLYGRHCLHHLARPGVQPSTLPQRYGDVLSSVAFNREITTPVQIHSECRKAVEFQSSTDSTLRP